MGTSPRNAALCERCERRRYIIGVKSDDCRAKRCPDCQTACTTCDGMDYEYFVDDDGYSYARPCSACGPLDRRIELFNRAHIPSKYAQSSSFDRFLCEGPDKRTLRRTKNRLYEYARAYTLGAKGFVLWGGVGSGKTHLMASVVRYLTIEKGVAARFIEFTHLLSQIREGYDHGDGEAAVLGPLIDVEVLAIDELGKGRANDWQTSVIDEIISKRYNRGLTTLATTNYGIEQAKPKSGATSAENRHAMTLETLAERVGLRIYSRLLEMSDLIHLDAGDYRQRQSRK